ncbi:kirola-like [Diospyros lotus]|uniref:kirola-like n=1 Tax=Diospyros lotus TaxID=55363 RepID=UPI00225A022C|nr:kirola-like [Diospyros lotus]
MARKLVHQVPIKSDGDVFHEIFKERPHHISNMSPAHIQGCALHEGDWGKVGSVTFWSYTHDGKGKVAKAVTEAVDEASKLVTYKVIEGDLMQLYKSFVITVHVDTRGTNNLVTWTFQYKKLNDAFGDPNSLMELCVNVIKDIEAHHLK